ncbi:hypothetical protein [Streptomyces griseorubiginosus]|uniref:hypothetical protein n=1 Tax=Streptomyces griseorubiginosus TaxID=67304 RepID=UPI0036509B02
MSLRAAAQRPGSLPTAGHGRDETDRTEPGGSAQSARYAAQSARYADCLAGRYPDGRVPTLAGTQANASCEGPAPCRRRPRLSPPLRGAPEASVPWSTADDAYGSARTARPWKDGPRSPRTGVLTPTEVSRTGNKLPPWGGAGVDRRATRAADSLTTRGTP